MIFPSYDRMDTNCNLIDFCLKEKDLNQFRNEATAKLPIPKSALIGGNRQNLVLD